MKKLLALARHSFMRRRLVLSFFIPIAIGIPSLFFTPCEAQYKNLLNFNGTNGKSPEGSLSVAGNKLYGMAYSGGKNGDGCIFSLDTNGGGYKDLLDFNGTNGMNPMGSLTISGSVMYGMTYSGGKKNDGSVFVVDTTGNNYKDLLDFDITNGWYPYGSLTLSGTVLYGMTALGGTNFKGNIFSISTAGTGYTDLHDFNGTAGSGPYGGITLSGSMLYGVTQGGGANGDGCIFSLNTTGNVYKDLLDFNGTNGMNPYGSLTLVGTVLYGTAYNGGAHTVGCIYSYNITGNTYTDLYDFNAGGISPACGLTYPGSGSMMYGVAFAGGAHDSGCIYSFNTTGSVYKDLFDFSGANGMNPYGAITTSGNMLYGMTQFGGTSYNGVVYSFQYKSSGTGINELSVVSCQWSVYPNPSSGKFTIQASGVSGHPDSYRESVCVYNVLGGKVYSLPIIMSGFNSQFSIDLSSQPNGVYFYRVVGEDGSAIGEGKMVIQK
jgi:uncharacterized repeat protein (TIGR03803 family)